MAEREVGIASALALIDIIEADRPPSPNHPQSRDRVSAVGMQAAEMKADIDWNYVCAVLKGVLDDASESCVGRRVFQECELASDDEGQKGQRIELSRAP